jgi:replicative DNA helicase
MVTIEDLKLPPHNIEAEKGVISAILLDNEVLYILD